ncbi:MAG: hypothetical protein ACRC0G_13795 [Fusobacteriaceae bacterium]
MKEREMLDKYVKDRLVAEICHHLSFYELDIVIPHGLEIEDLYKMRGELLGY